MEEELVRQKKGHQQLLIAAIVLGGFLSLYNSVAMNVAIPTVCKSI